MKNPIATTTTTDRSTFTFAATGNTIRVIERDGEPWFVAADVCRVLGLRNTTVTVRPLEAGEKSKFFLGYGRDAVVVSESGLYKLIMRAYRKHPVARPFQDWGTNVVLPVIGRLSAVVTARACLSVDRA